MSDVILVYGSAILGKDVSLLVNLIFNSIINTSI